MVAPPTVDVMDLAAAVRHRLVPTPPTVLELDLSQGLLSVPATGPREVLRSLHTPTMQAIRTGLRKAGDDPEVAGLVVHTGTCQASAAQLDELGELIAAFGERKPTLAWSETFGELTNDLFAHRLASHCHQIWLGPSGMLGSQGVDLTVTLLRGSLDKVGVEPQFGQRHEYKSAADQFVATEVSDANREMMQRIADSLLDESVERIARRRALEPEAVRAEIDRAPLTAEQAVAAGLVDRIGYRDQVYDWVSENWGAVLEPRPWQSAEGRDDGPRVHLQYVHRYAKDQFGAVASGLTRRNRPAIGVVAVQGGIVSGTGRRGPLQDPQAGSDAVTAQLRTVRRDDKVKAVILRVDSPGGSYVASDSIRREVVRLREAGIPVVASMGGVAASGGYFVSMGADEIVVNPSTLTGSIGVLAGKLVTSGLTDKVGLVRESMSAGDNATMFSTLAPFTERHWEVLNTWLDAVYRDFTTKAAADRGLDLTVLEPLARGRVWTGADAVRHRLADHLGGVDLAIERACALAEVDRDDATLKAAAAGPWWTQLRPAESSESRHAESRMGVENVIASAGGIEGLWRAAATAAGLAPTGVLSLPYRFDIG